MSNAFYTIYQPVWLSMLGDAHELSEAQASDSESASPSSPSAPPSSMVAPLDSALLSSSTSHSSSSDSVFSFGSPYLANRSACERCGRKCSGRQGDGNVDDVNTNSKHDVNTNSNNRKTQKKRFYAPEALKENVLNT